MINIRHLARATDPLSSIQAAEAAALFGGAHRARILRALDLAGTATAHELTEATGLTVVQIDRRLPELRRDGVADIVQVNGEDLMRGGFRVWHKISPKDQQKV